MSASAEFHDLIVATLRADAGVGAIVADRIYDIAPPLATRVFPDVTLGPSDYVPDDADCIPGREETAQIDCWTREAGRLRSCRSLVDAVRKALHERALTLSANALVTITASGRVLRDPDGLTGHGVVTVTGMIEEAA